MTQGNTWTAPNFKRIRALKKEWHADCNVLNKESMNSQRHLKIGKKDKITLYRRMLATKCRKNNIIRKSSL